MTLTGQVNCRSIQGLLFDEAESIDIEMPAAPTEANVKKKKPGRKPFSDQLPREQVFINLTAAEKEGAIDTFYTKVKEELDIIPAKVRILEIMQEKAVFLEKGQRRIISATLPKHPIERAMGSVSLMCFVIIAKYADGLPLYPTFRTSFRNKFVGKCHLNS